MVRIVHSILTDWVIYHETHVFATVIRSFHYFQDWQLQVSGGRVFSVQVNHLLYKHAPSVLERFIQMLFSIPFRTDQTRKAIPVNSLLNQLQLAPLKQ